MTLHGHELGSLSSELRPCSGTLRGGPCQPPLEGTSTPEQLLAPPRRVGSPLQTQSAGHGSTSAVTTIATTIATTAATLSLLRRRHTTAATTIQATTRGQRVRHALRNVLHTCSLFHAMPGDHLLIHPRDLYIGLASDFCLAVAPPPALITVWGRTGVEEGGEAIDIHALLRDATAEASAGAARLQAGVRGWFVRRSLLSTPELEAEIASQPPCMSPHRLTPADLYLHHVASRLSWVYCERLPPGFTELNPIADALALWRTTDALAAPSSPLNPVGRASNAKKRGRQRKAAARAQRNHRVTRRATSHSGVLSQGGGLFRHHSSRWDLRRLAWLREAQTRAEFERAAPYLRETPVSSLPHMRQDLEARDPYLLELSIHFGEHIVDGLRPPPHTAPSESISVHSITAALGWEVREEDGASADGSHDDGSSDDDPPAALAPAPQYL